MIVYCCQITVLIFDSYSLKDKRSVIKSIISKTHQKYNISISEVGSNELHNKGEIGFCCISSSSFVCEQIIQSVLNFIESNYNLDIIEANRYQC
ncbi:MAG: DUF503 domain-containing protein [bacterium]